MNRFDVLSEHYDTVTLGVEKLEELEALCRTLWMREKGREPVDRHRVALMRCALNQAGQWCDIFQKQSEQLAEQVKQCRSQPDGGGKATVDDAGAHKDSVGLLIEVCSQIEVLCSELVNEKPEGALARLAYDVAEEALCDFDAIEFDAVRLVDSLQSGGVVTEPVPASPAQALVERIAGLYSGEALPNDPTELRITGHDVYLAQKAKAELGGGV